MLLLLSLKAPLLLMLMLLSLPAAAAATAPAGNNVEAGVLLGRLQPLLANVLLITKAVVKVVIIVIIGSPGRRGAGQACEWAGGLTAL